MRLFGLLAFGLVAGSCHEATGPSATLPQPDVLVIAPALDALKVGATETLNAVLASGDGTRHTVRASWSSDAPEVVAIDDDGRVRALRLGSATIRASFEALVAVRPMRVVPDYDGTWNGEYRVVNCTRLAGSGPSYCKYFFGAVFPLRTVLGQQGASLGTIDFYSNTGQLTESGQVEARVDPSGALVLTGTARSILSEQPGETRLSEWKTTLAGDGDQMTGSFVRNRRFRNFWGWQESKEDCALVKMTRLRPDS